jgi:hypothetical protein
MKTYNSNALFERVPFHLVFTLIGLIVFCSCSPQYYFSDKVQTTIFTEKNQFVANASIKPQLAAVGIYDSLNGKPISVSFDAAYSFHQHFGLGLYYANLNRKSLTEDIGVEHANNTGGLYNGERFEISCIYFKKTKENELLELSGGFGKGYLDHRSGRLPYQNYNLKYNTYFAQITYSYLSKHHIASVGSKLKFNHYSVDATNSFRNQKYGYTLYPLESLPVLYARFFINSEVFYRCIGFNSQIGFTIQPSRQLLADIPFYITAGLTFRLQKGVFKNNFRLLNYENLQ